jgi:hypothetical protein
MQKCCSHFEVALHGITLLSLIGVAASLTRCIFLITFAANSTDTGISLTSHVAFDYIHSLIQFLHIIEYSVLLYGIGGFYFYAWIKREKYGKLNDLYTATGSRLMCTCSCTCVGFILSCVFGVVIFAASALAPAVIQATYPEDIIGSEMEVLVKIYTVFPYICHFCHLVIRIFMVFVTVVIQSAWLPQVQSQSGNQENCFTACAIMLFRPKWLKDDPQGDLSGDPPGDTDDAKEQFKALIDDYNNTGQSVVVLHAIFQQWFVMQWLIYFIKIIEDASVAVHTLVTKQNRDEESEKHELLFILTHLVFDLILFLVPYICGSLFNQYHDTFRRRLQKKQSDVLAKVDDAWLLRCAELIPENPNYVFTPSFCGLAIPLSSSGYNLSIGIALFAFIIAILTSTL